MPVKHIALIRFKEGTPDSIIANLFTDLQRLSRTLPGAVDYSYGRDSSPESLAQGFTHGFVMTFADPSARDAYLVDPEHVSIKENILPHVQSVVVLDYDY